MRVVIVRHAEAAQGSPDELRPLTPSGREQARRLGEELRAQGMHPDAVVTSPLLRARETAARLALGEPEIDDRLAPGATPEDLRAVAEERGETVVLVGHNPDCARAVAALRGDVNLHFPPCAHAVIELG